MIYKMHKGGIDLKDRYCLFSVIERILRQIEGFYRLILFLFVECVDYFEFEIFGIILVCHVAGNDALKQIFFNASSGNVIDDCLHTLHEVVGMPIISIMNEEPDLSS